MLAPLWLTRLPSRGTEPERRRRASTAPALKPGSRGTSRGRAAAHLRADRRRPLEPDLRGHRRRRPRWALRRPPLASGSARPRHGPRAQGRLRARRRPRCRCRRSSASARTRRQRRPLLRDGVRRGADPARPGRRRGLPRRGRPAGDRRARRRHAGRDPRGRPGRRRARRPRPQGGLRRPPAAPLAGSVGEVEDARAARRSTRSTRGSRRGSPSRARRRSSTATTASTT